LFQIAPAGAQSQSLAVNRALFSSGVSAAPPTAPGRLPAADLVTTTIALNPGQSIALSSKRGSFALVGVRPDQLVQVTVKYPALKTARTITAEALDGGQVLKPGPMRVGLDGAIHFEFRAGRSPGINHVALHDRARELGLQFWVLDAQHPERNPVVVNPGN